MVKYKENVNMENKLILASSSPRRQALLRLAQLPYSIRIPDLDESMVTSNNPIEKVSELAKMKNKKIPLYNENEVIIAADTVVSYNQSIFEKPSNKKEAKDMIRSLSGHTHQVYTGVCIRNNAQERTFAECTEVTFWELSDEEMNQYINTKEPYDKAGGYGIQSLGAMFVKEMVGDYYNVVGLPISRVVRELRSFSIFPEFDSI